MKKDEGSCCSKLSVCNLGMAVGIVWGLTLFFCAMLTLFSGMGAPVVEIFSTIYWGLDATIIGAVLGLFWGLIWGYVMGALVAYFYNVCAAKCPCNYCKINRKHSK